MALCLMWDHREQTLMGSDDLFHKRKAKQKKDLRRRNARKAPYPRVLIVCEGGKTEPHGWPAPDFNGLKDHYRLRSANVEVCGESGSAPVSVYDYAEERQLEAKRSGNRFDYVYCVFDKDTHPSYSQAVDQITRTRNMQAITSVPCFEYWLLLHFESTTSPYTAMPGKSACDQVLADLRIHMPGYSKANKNMLTNELIGKLDIAISNAQHTLQAAEDTGTDNPTTYVHELVKHLRDLKNNALVK